MYILLKRLLKAIIPTTLLINHENLFRKLVYPFYMGESYICNICRKGLDRFILLQNGEKLCPYCGSLGRNRRLFSLLNPNLKNQITVLDFSPSRCLFRTWSTNPDIQYVGSDFSGEFLATKKIDITKTQEPSNHYDVVICFHILEHIHEDLLAMQELRRIVKAKGKCYIQTPFKNGEIFEDSLIQDEAGREKHFGQKDHVRVYSVEGLQSRLQDCGFEVSILSFKEDPKNVNGYCEEEYILLAEPHK